LITTTRRRAGEGGVPVVRVRVDDGAVALLTFTRL
jgi:hypothetical protein